MSLLSFRSEINLFEAMVDSNQIRWRIIVCVVFIAWTSLYVSADDTEVFPPPWEGPIPQCPENEFFKRCMGNCSNCEERGMCPLVAECTQSGCDCIPRYVRLTPGGVCEPVSKCPIPTCGENEVFRPCGPVCERCSTLRCHVITCDYKCYCKEGYMRNPEGKCIPEDECEPRTRCTIGEEFGSSGLVDENCLHEDTEVVSNATEVKDRCYCKEGHRRNSMGHCTSEDFCQFFGCRHGEVFHRCVPKCNSTCHNYGDSSCVEDKQCYPGCFCPEGLVMNDHRSCVRPKDCPAGSNPLAPTVAPTTTGTQTSPFSREPTTPAPTKGAEVSATSKDETTPPTDATSGGDDDDTSLKTTASDISTESSDTTPKPKRDKHAKSRPEAKPAKNPTKSPKMKVITPDVEDENE